MTEHNDPRSTGTPGCAKVFGIVALVVAVAVVVMLLTGRGGHGPGRHTLFATDVDASHVDVAKPGIDRVGARTDA